MKNFLSRLFAVPWYPLVFSAYPVLALLASNIGQVKASASLRLLLISGGSAGILFVLLYFIFKNWHRAGFLLTLLLALFFSYGHLYIVLAEKYPDFNLSPWMLIAWTDLAVGALFWAWKQTPSASGLNVIALGLVTVSLVQVNSMSEPQSAHALGAEYAPVESDLVRPENPPDVYYFILDSYGREDLLQQAYGYDNSEFVSELEKRGFYVPKCSQSNYIHTTLSLGSSLNMQYLPALSNSFNKPESTSQIVLWDSLKHSAARFNFESMGYETVNFATSFAWNELYDADHFISPPPISSGMTEFEVLFLRTTLARYAENLGWMDPNAVLGENFRDRFKNIFNNMDMIAKMPQPTFSYIHVISPHPPFVFDPEGNPTNPLDFLDKQPEYPPDLYAKGYQNQLTYLNKSVLIAVDTILANSKTPPIIIFQGDHGPWLQPQAKRLWIFNAYYFPGHKDVLYPTISP
ncbi:MAG: LTA synthase family protein, partial [Anaerolineales bacterium]|nr:LTA synthase family protein [Anaerolineales bacterium]